MRMLDISSKMIFTTTKKKDDVGVLQVDDRGHHGNGGVKVIDCKKDDIRDHIKSFLCVPSHYTRSRSAQKYLDGSLSISAMYRMYKTKCVEEGKEYAKQNTYETIFNTEFNLGFFVPKKDLLQTCETFKNLSEEEKILQKVSYQRHLNEKELCRTEKQNDLNTADGNTEIICFDLQAVVLLLLGMTVVSFIRED